MDGYVELAAESAEDKNAGLALQEKRLSPRLRRLSFVAERPFGDPTRESGAYHTLIADADPLTGKRVLNEIARETADILSSLIERKVIRILAVGLGNPSAVVDALGCETVKKLATGERGRGYLAAIVPSVYGLTGLESAEIVRGVTREYRPDLILTVDTLATRRPERLFRAVQIGKAGVTPGGGVGNRRTPLSPETLGAPVISLGVPLLAHADRCSGLPAGLVVTPKEIDLIVPLFAETLCRGMELALSERLG